MPPTIQPGRQHGVAEPEQSAGEEPCGGAEPRGVEGVEGSGRRQLAGELHHVVADEQAADERHQEREGRAAHATGAAGALRTTASTGAMAAAKPFGTDSTPFSRRATGGAVLVATAQLTVAIDPSW